MPVSASRAKKLKQIMHGNERISERVN